MATYFVMEIFFFCFCGTKLWKWRRYSSCAWFLCMNCIFNLLLMSLECSPAFYRGARSSTLIHSGYASRGNREKGVSAGWGRVRCCGGAGWKNFLPPFGLSVLHAHWRLQILIFLMAPLSSDVKANYIYHSHFEKLGDVIIHPVLVVA